MCSITCFLMMILFIYISMQKMVWAVTYIKRRLQHSGVSITYCVDEMESQQCILTIETYCPVHSVNIMHTFTILTAYICMLGLQRLHIL